MTVAEKGHFKTTVRIPDKLMRLVEASYKLDTIVINTLLCEALEHFCACPVDNPRAQLDQMKQLISELHDRTSKLELKFAKHHTSRVS